MPHYVVDREPQPITGDHIVHAADCAGFPTRYHDIGWHPDCARAVAAARYHYPDANGCQRCGPDCVRKTRPGGPAEAALDAPPGEETAPERGDSGAEAVARFRRLRRSG